MSRIIPLDGRPHRKGYRALRFMAIRWGTGKATPWVIVTKISSVGWMDDYFYTNPKEFRMHSDALTTTERIQWKNKDTISYLLTIDDPKDLHQAWSQEFQTKLKPEWDQVGLFEYVCEENNRCPGGKCQGN